MEITDLKCAVIGQNPIVRIVTDEGLSGYGEVENTKPYLKPHVLFYKRYLIGEDPTNVERVMLKIRRQGSFKPWGSAVSAISRPRESLAQRGRRSRGREVDARAGAHGLVMDREHRRGRRKRR